MFQAFLTFFTKTFAGKSILTLLISMVPVIELRGALPVAIAAYHLPLWYALPLCIIGNLLPVPFIIIFIKKIFAWMRKIFPKLDGLVTRLEERAARKSDTVQKYAFWGLFLLVAIPLPGTGAWTGALVAAMLDMDLKRAFPAIALGVVGAAVIVLTVTYGVSAFVKI